MEIEPPEGDVLLRYAALPVGPVARLPSEMRFALSLQISLLLESLCETTAFCIYFAGDVHSDPVIRGKTRSCVSEFHL
jgi:hypothetical protein